MQTLVAHALTCLDLIAAKLESLFGEMKFAQGAKGMNEADEHLGLLCEALAKQRWLEAKEGGEDAAGGQRCVRGLELAGSGAGEVFRAFAEEGERIERVG